MLVAVVSPVEEPDDNLLDSLVGPVIQALSPSIGVYYRLFLLYICKSASCSVGSQCKQQQEGNS